MTEASSTRESTLRSGARRHGGARDKLLMVVVLLILIRTAESLAGEQTTLRFAPQKPDFKSGTSARREPSALTMPIPGLPNTYQAIGPVTEDPLFPSDFRPRGRSILDRDSQAAAFQDPPMSNGTSVWQRLGEYHSHGRVCLLTLWEAGGNSLSLQAGKKGQPSLQWTSHSMNHGGATRGLFDQLLPASMTNGSRNSHGAPHATSGDPATRPTKQSEAGMGAAK
jgi:hypothetical protein